MTGSLAGAEHKKRIDQVIDYILSNPTSEISLQTLSGLAHYSPFHLQKIFKQIIGESPKQYQLKLRLETTFHLLMIHPQKPIQEIAADSGFSSPAVFSRAMKSYFGHTPGQLRELSHLQQMKILYTLNPKSLRHPVIAPSALHAPVPGTVTIQIVKKETLRGIYRIAPFNDPEKIQAAFQDLARIARAYDPVTGNSVFYGILAPHQRNIYKAFLPLSREDSIGNKFPFTQINGGIFAKLAVRGDLKQTNQAVHYFYNCWLPDSGYKIAHITAFETISGNPASTSYSLLEREIHIPIEPAV